MPDVIVIGDGPGGLSAALFLAKNGKDVLVFGQDKTAMHWAQVSNYLGIPDIHGSEFQKTARAQVIKQGGTIRDERVDSVAKANDGFAITTEGGETLHAKYLVLSEGKSPRLSTMLGLEHSPDVRDVMVAQYDGAVAAQRDFGRLSGLSERDVATARLLYSLPVGGPAGTR